MYSADLLSVSWLKAKNIFFNLLHSIAVEFFNGMKQFLGYDFLPI
jgi:hypothetical protein